MLSKLAQFTVLISKTKIVN